MKVYVTGMGIISALGVGKDATIKSLKMNRSFITKSSDQEGIWSEKHFGEVPFSTEELVENSEFNEGLSNRTLSLGIIAAREALKQSNIEVDKNNRVGLVFSTTVGGASLTEKHYKNYLSGTSTPNFFKSNDITYNAMAISSALGITQNISTINTACSSSAHAIAYGARLIKGGMLDQVIVGGSDALSYSTIHGFNSLCLLTDGVCKPFDRNRKGINLGEGAGFICLESESAIKKRQSKALCQLSGYGLTNDFHHISSSSPEGQGIQLAMQKAMEMTNCNPEDIGYLNAHGTATPNNDLTEGIAIKKIFNNHPLSFSSTKSMTGHTLAAAGVIESILSILAMNNSFLIPNVNFEETMPEHQMMPVSAPEDKEINHVLTNAAGMGGYCSSLLYSK
ncbi:beta-ketoacyl-[acyl-carrier-protein] synthase family protein [Marivirga sp. S37H4]|uniref:Beta-ketoacyl-[acyl-carrier-protein] synthase family protein n=1 Tax=Marivirga aurantiaca TaxID=2802615 RepID=A0A934WYL6_9BACT|nr:beta-ketoacyl-[acyl-carrier-protein] synthase family protein [Marivirga aurantiaca]MBK6265311.1 beta-ketoacyl-[acyl-carrier-protein] synthase family protein [Marivirga aurantiaca]